MNIKIKDIILKNNMFLVIYEKLSIDYNERMLEEIKSLGDWQHVTSNVWIINSDLVLEDISTRLKSCMVYPKMERILVFELPDNIKYKGWMPKCIWPWLKKYINKN